MKTYLILLVVLLSMLVGCQSMDNQPSLDEHTQDDTHDSIDYELLQSIRKIKNTLIGAGNLQVKSNHHITLSSKLSMDDDPVLFLDEERLHILISYYTLLERIVVDGYQTGTEIDAMMYVIEDDYFFSENLVTLKINITKTDEKINSYMIRELVFDLTTIFIKEQLFGEFIDNTLNLKRLMIQDDNYFYEEFIESKGLLTLVYEPINGEKVHYENVFLVTYNDTTNIVVNYIITMDDIFDFYLIQYIEDDVTQLRYRIETYDQLAYTLQKYQHMEDVFLKLNNHEIESHAMDNAIATILEWPNVLRWSSFENLIDYVVFQDRMIPFIDFEIIQGKIPEEYYMDYFDAYQNYMMLLSKEEKNLDDFYRIYDIVFYFYARLGLTPEDISFSTASYPPLILIY